MPAPLIDTYQRRHDNLRISVTDRCNIRCFYCMPEHPVEFVPRDEILSFEEIERFTRIAVGLGIRKLRITGGEPLLRKSLPELIRRLARIQGVEDLSLTTNGILLGDLAGPLYAAGLRRINVHLDTLDRERFQRITRRDELRRVLNGIQECRRLGYDPIKINVVAVRDLVEPDLVPLALFGRENGLEVRYIEFMPLDAQGIWLPEKVLPADDIIGVLSRQICPLEEIPDGERRAPASRYRFADGVGTIGVIGALSRPFCRNCNRIRLTADGKLRYCLFALEETDVRGLLRQDADEEAIAAVIRATVGAKWEGHEINSARFASPLRPMYAIGG